ncbi:hypothetical protein F511_42246 [Dorcoceras hygrometricum]|uniref:Uncharacterized protein n=1 Tax=Dorcoceras hygrometricum TaxID=472368 RepID=A0A2Z7A7E5_9LAMI|nr:hypothetical protein F511_42246 [Dorcoceras hygrometricum]
MAVFGLLGDVVALCESCVRMNTISSIKFIEDLTEIEDDLMVRAETERVPKLMLGHELIRSKIVVNLLEKSVKEHWNPLILENPLQITIS